MLLVLSLVVDICWPSNVACNTISKTKVITSGTLSGLMILKAFEVRFELRLLTILLTSFPKKHHGRSSFSEHDCLIIVTNLQHFSMATNFLGAERTYLIRGPVDDVEASEKSAIEAKDDVERQKTFGFATKKSTTDALNDVENWKERAAASIRREEELLSNGFAPLSEIAIATAKLRQTWCTIC